MTVQTNFFPSKADEIIIKELYTEEDVTFPIINWGLNMTIFPTMEQLEDLHSKIGEFLKAQEVAE